MDPNELDLRFVGAATPQSVALAWAAEPSAITYDVMRDGALLATTSVPEFEENSLPPSSNFVYEIIAKDSTGTPVGSRAVPIGTPDPTANKSRKDLGIQTYQTYTTSFIYRTFIAPSSVSMDFMTAVGCGQAGFDGRTFGGDGRSWVTPPYNTPWDSTSYRTSAFININWNNPAGQGDVSWVTDVSPTRLYDHGNLIETRTASSANFNITNAYKSGSYAQARINHSVGNPWCIAGAITYDVTARFYRSGTIEVAGSRFPVPNHEVYGGWDNPSTGLPTWRPLVQVGNEGFGCLTGACGTKPVIASKTY
ncbi:hypothetical protein GCM10027416_03630 [Okibacterium endophyticum]